MRLHFTKMQGAGNDFVVLDATRTPLALSAADYRFLGDRRFGVGADQILVVERSATPGVDFRYRIFNADGGEVEQCGNGARCFVRFVHDKKLTQKSRICVETASGIIYPKLEDNGLVTVDMGAPRFEPTQIPFVADKLAETYPLQVGTEVVTISSVSMGNPHAVQIVPNVDTAAVASQGPLIENHERFPQRVNAGFMQIVDEHHIRLRVFERGAGETLACGTGACAAAVAGIQLGKLQSPVTVSMRGGELSIAWQDASASVMMTGPAVTVFEGQLSL